MKLLIKFPTRNRREKFFGVLDKYYSLLENPNTQFVITLDVDDSEMNNDYVINKLNEYKNLVYYFGESTSKINAINRDVSLISDWDIVLVASDDMIPQIVGYDQIIINKMKQIFPDTDGILFFNDGFKGHSLNTLSILGRKYYERFNYIYYPEYKSVWADNEFTEVGNILQKQIFFEEVIIKHEHPDWGFGNHDKIHRENIVNEMHDRNLYLQRKTKNFGL